MKINAFRRPSPAMVVASLALLVALGGTGVAAVNALVPKNSVGTAQLKNGAVTAAKVKAGSLLASNFKAGQLTGGAAGPAGPAGPSGATGPAGAAGPAGPSAKWALIKSDGAIIAQSGGITLTTHAVGTYVLDFGAPVDKSLIVATPSFATTGLRGDVIAGPCGGPPAGSLVCASGGDNNHVVVFTSNAANSALADWPFYIAVIG
jgi:hypothetical protein